VEGAEEAVPEVEVVEAEVGWRWRLRVQGFLRAEVGCGGL
jgi:hypothetical protein